MEIGASLALLALAAMVLNAGVGWMVISSARVGAGEALAAQAARVVAQQMESERGLPGGEAASWGERPGVRALLEIYREGAGARSLDVTLWDASGAVIAGAGALPPEARGVLATREVVSGGAGSEVWAVAPIGSSRDGLVGVRLPLAEASAPAWVFVAGHAVGSAALLGAFGWLLLRRRLVLPVEALRDATARIAEGAFGARVSTDAPEEIAALAESLNEMSAALAAYRVRTEEQVARLRAADEDRQRAQEALVRTERLASVGQLAAGLAHELGNPLAAVRGYVELLRDDARPADADLLRRCDQEVQRMHALVRRVLDFARPERVRCAEADLGVIVEEACASVAPQAGFVGVEVSFRVPEGLRAQGDAGRLHQVLVNLLRNAAAAGARRVSVDATPVDHGVEIAVRDDGSGIAPALLEKIFEPFFTTRPPGEGTGLGLAVARRMAEEQGGHLSVESVPGKGSCFTIRLPRRVPAPGAT